MGSEPSEGADKRDVFRDMLAALKAVEEWWLRDGMAGKVGAPYAIFAVRAAIAKAEHPVSR